MISEPVPTENHTDNSNQHVSQELAEINPVAVQQSLEKVAVREEGKVNSSEKMVDGDNAALIIAKDIEHKVLQIKSGSPAVSPVYQVAPSQPFSKDFSSRSLLEGSSGVGEPSHTPRSDLHEDVKTIVKALDKSLKIATDSMEKRKKISSTPLESSMARSNSSSLNNPTSDTIALENILNENTSNSVFAEVFESTEIFRDPKDQVLQGVNQELWHVPNIDSKRGLAVRELIESEREYVRDLAALVFLWLDTIQSMSSVSSSSRQVLIRNTHQILKHQRKLLHFLEFVTSASGQIALEKGDDETSLWSYSKDHDKLYYLNGGNHHGSSNTILNAAGGKSSGDLNAGEKSLYSEGETALDIDALTLIATEKQAPEGSWGKILKGTFRKSLSMIMTSEEDSALSPDSMAKREQSLINYVAKLPNESFIPYNLAHTPRIGKCFLLLKEGFELYNTFCMKHDEAMEILAKVEQKSTFSEMTLKCYKFLGTRLKLVDFFIKPIQRICKYPLILREIYRCMGDDANDAACKKELADTMSMLEDFLSRMNKQKSVYEMERKAAFFLAHLEPFVGCPSAGSCGAMIYGQKVLFSVVTNSADSHEIVGQTSYKSYFLGLFTNYTFICRQSGSKLESKFFWKTSSMSFHIPQDSSKSARAESTSSAQSPQSPSLSMGSPSSRSRSPSSPLNGKSSSHPDGVASVSLFVMQGDKVFHVIFPSRKDCLAWIDHFRSLYLLEQKGNPCPAMHLGGKL